MFNDLNNPNSQGHPAVDDIFAETDKASGGASSGNINSSNSGIEAKRVGLTATDGTVEEISERAAGNKWFKISLIAVIVAIVILGSYLVYSKFFKASPDLNANTMNSNVNTAAPAANNNQTPAPAAPAASNSGSFVTPTGENAATGSLETIPPIPGVNAPATSSLAATTSGDVVTSSPDALIDSDNDGLTDAEEKALGTNINVIDTDNDGLSDYEEVKIYHTNPLSADTDGDGYLDGAEVKNGYNPNGPGKLVKPLN